MSHYFKCTTVFRDEAALLEALAECGFSREQVEIHATAQALYGYMGDARPETAEIIIRRQYVGCASNDLGFKKQSDGTYQLIVSDYDRGGRCGQAWQDKLKQEYQVANSVRQLKRKGMVPKVERLPNGKVAIRATVVGRR